MVNENRVEGAARNIGGKIQDAVGAVTGDAETQARGQMNRAAGSAQNAYGQAVDEVKSFATDQPVVALLSAMALGVVIGFLWVVAEALAAPIFCQRRCILGVSLVGVSARSGASPERGSFLTPEPHTTALLTQLFGPVAARRWICGTVALPTGTRWAGITMPPT